MSYNSEDIQQILQGAMARRDGEFSRDQLAEMARELGISIDLLEATEREWKLKRDEARDRKQFNALKRQGFNIHLICYVAVNGLLVLINLLTGGVFWAIWSIAGWGLGLFFHWWFTRPQGESYEHAFQDWRQQRRR